MSSTEPKTERPSAKRVRDALKKGNRPRSVLVANGVGILFWMLFGYIGWNFVTSLIWPLAIESMVWDLTDYRNGIFQAGALLFIAVIVVSLCAFAIAALSAVVSVGATHGQLAPAPEALELKAEKFNPAANAKNLFSLKQLYQLVKNVLYVVILGWVTWLVGKTYVGASLSLYRSGPTAIQAAAPYALILAFTVGLGVTLLFAFADRALEKILWMKELMMTKSEVKREYEEQNGNPHIKAQRMATARQAASAARGDAEKYGNLVVFSPSDSRIVVMHTNKTFKRPLVLWKEIGGAAEQLASYLRSVGAETITNSFVAESMYGKAQPGDFLNGSTNEFLALYRNG